MADSSANVCASICVHITLKPHHSPALLGLQHLHSYGTPTRVLSLILTDQTSSQRYVSMYRPRLTDMSLALLFGLLHLLWWQTYCKEVKHLCGCTVPISVICFHFFSPIFVSASLIYNRLSVMCLNMERKSIHLNFAFHMKHIQA